MAEHLQKKSLLIVSDTAMAKTGEGVSVFEPALREIENLSGLFTHITWIGFNYGTNAELAMRLSKPGLINFIVLPKATGGDSFFAKLKILPYLPYLFFVILRNILNHDVVHTRGPSIPAMFAAMISLVDRSRLYWHKYAGNWKQENAPWAYAFHRTLLKWNTKTVVTINGRWDDQQNHIISFANPCLTQHEMELGRKSLAQKSFTGQLTLLFVGNLIPSKGPDKLLEALKSIDAASVSKVMMAGDGSQRKELENIARELPVKVDFCGAVPRAQLEEYYKTSHILVLLSNSEGFPKVVAEAAAFGCVPIAFSVSSISQYVKHGESGVLLKADSTVSEIAEALKSMIQDKQKLAAMATHAAKMSEVFTYDIYRQRVQNEILSKK
jgi:glycosyltransferase involved in cell wall biosynthesis